MPDKEKVIEWFEYDYLPRVGAYRKDCKQGCDACVPMHDGDDYCDIDMLCKILALLKQPEVVQCEDCKYWLVPCSCLDEDRTLKIISDVLKMPIDLTSERDNAFACETIVHRIYHTNWYVD